MRTGGAATAAIGSNSAAAGSRDDSAELIEALAAVAIDQLRALRSIMRLDKSGAGRMAEHETFHNVEVMLFAMRAESDRIGRSLVLVARLSMPPC